MMIERTKTRELFAFECLGNTISGTCHLPVEATHGQSSTGIVFFCGFPMPRSAHGDAAVRWATDCARLGYPTFRVDLPGMGESYGSVPAELLQYTTAGGYEQVAAALVESIVAHFGLAEVVILGQCAGAVSAVFAASATKKCHGLILVEPPFNAPPAVRPKVKRALFHWLLRNRVGSLLIHGYDQVKKARLHLRKNAPPENANFPLLKRWKDIASAGMPILVLNAPQPKSTDDKPRAGTFDYLKHILALAGSRSRVEVRTVADTNHSFSDPIGKAALGEHVAEWMPRFFPLNSTSQAQQTPAADARSKDATEFSKSASAFASVDASF